MASGVLILLLFFSFCVFAVKRCLTYLHIYQQEEYDSRRFLPWLVKSRSFDKRVSLGVLLIGVMSFFIPLLFTMILLITVFAIATFIEPDPRREAKKALVLTKRAQRIFIPSALAAVALCCWVFLFPQFTLLWLINIQLIPLLICVMNDVQQPFERSIQAKFLQEAKDKLEVERPYIIGVTGSFGKTSVKHILGHILKMKAPTLITPGSVNTPMGITRIIREQLEPQHRYFIVEMGAYGPGSIERLCALTPPDMGLITAIGHAHYERFKTLETVAEAKYELAKAVLRKEDGIMLVHERTLAFENSKKMRAEYKDQFTAYGEKNLGSVSPNTRLGPSDVRIISISQSVAGIEITFDYDGMTYDLHAPIYGLHHGHNIVIAFLAAMKLGMSAEDIQTALSTLPQIPHRLEVKPQTDSRVIIDDAYNSNPVGFASALELLSIYGRAKKARKILITPGMVELGSAHEEAHSKIALKAAQSCDIAIIVNPERIPSFIKSFKAAGGKSLIEVGSFAAAQKWANENKQPKDVILIENDLPDLYERKLKI
ncbi:MAG: UDP-N-acetylmuramoyl-tripeptide--D-alanyl-D-alanine ligase [Micavibrio sp.]|nr:UDP-N-acetylmuramoyl-tripeptide--D-alanyl-D-alanine ligase [Micavibrio sp.]